MRPAHLIMFSDEPDIMYCACDACEEPLAQVRQRSRASRGVAGRAAMEGGRVVLVPGYVNAGRKDDRPYYRAGKSKGRPSPRVRGRLIVSCRHCATDNLISALPPGGAAALIATATDQKVAAFLDAEQESREEAERRLPPGEFLPRLAHHPQQRYTYYERKVEDLPD